MTGTDTLVIAVCALVILALMLVSFEWFYARGLKKKLRAQVDSMIETVEFEKSRKTKS